jgi:hypothetical protein
MRHLDTRSFHNFSENYKSRCELSEGNDAEIALSLQQFTNARNHPSKSALPVFPTQKRNKLLWILSLAVFLLAAGATLIGAWLAGRSSAVPVVVQPAPKAASQGVELGMRVEVEGGNLRVSWNRETPATQFAKDAILQIDEGLQHRQLQLNAAQVADGSLLYKPASDDVTLHLEIQGAGTSRVSQTVRVVDGSKPQADFGSEGRPPLPTHGIPKRRAPKSPRQFEPKTMFQATAAGLQVLRRSSPNLQSEIAARPPDIPLPIYQNAASLPFGPANAPPGYSTLDRRTKFFKAIKHLALPSTRLRESFEP